MSIPSVIHRICEYGRIVSHAVRYQVLVAGVAALVRSQCLSLTAMGRAMGGAQLPKHGIKRIDRLLSNGHLYRERPELFRGRELWLRLDLGRGEGHHHKVRTGGTDAKFGLPAARIDDFVARKETTRSALLTDVFARAAHP